MHKIARATLIPLVLGFAGVILTQRDACAAPVQTVTPDAARAREVAGYMEMIEEAVKHSDLTIGWRLSQFRAAQKAETKKRTAAITNEGEKFTAEMAADAASPVPAAVYGLLRKHADELDALKVLKLVKVFGGDENGAGGFPGFSTYDAVRHIAAALKSKPPEVVEGFKDTICALGILNHPELGYVAPRLADFKKYFNKPPERNNNVVRINFTFGAPNACDY